MRKILIIEDELPISDLIKLNVELAGFQAIQAFGGMEGLEALNANKPDLILLDIMLPQKSGFEILPQISANKTPVIILSAVDGLIERVKGLNMGADDYITKPFESVELLARINAVLRRHASDDESQMKTHKFDDIAVYFESREVTRASKPLDLTLKEFELLKYLIQNNDIVLSRSTLLERIWGYDYIGSTRTIDMHIQKLRQKLGTTRIKTVYKVGYKFDSNQEG